MKKPENLAIIPARGGSKRIPGKNIRDFFGKPIISYSIETSLKSGLFNTVMVSTDNPEIAEIAKKFGAEVPFLRTSVNSDDNATLSDVVDEVTARFNAKGKAFDYICCILPTCPMITVQNLKKGFEMIASGKFSSVRPVVAYSYPVQRAYKIKEDTVEFLYPEYQRIRSQDLEKIYHDSGQFYWIKAGKRLADLNRGAFEIPALNAQDIDNEDDWKMAELKYKLINQQ